MGPTAQGRESGGGPPRGSRPSHTTSLRPEPRGCRPPRASTARAVSKLFAPPLLREPPWPAQLARPFQCWRSAAAPRDGVPPNDSRHSQYELPRPQTHCKTTTQPGEPSAESTVRLLAACAGTRSTKLLGLAPARVGHQQAAVIRRQDLLDLSLRRLVDNCRPGGRSERGESVGRKAASAKQCLDRCLCPAPRASLTGG
jgi:hypothetical protein